MLLGATGLQGIAEQIMDAPNSSADSIFSIVAEIGDTTNSTEVQYFQDQL
jgi:hypothetical protein